MQYKQGKVKYVYIFTVTFFSYMFKYTKKNCLLLFSGYECFACISVCLLCAYNVSGDQKRVGAPDTGVTDSSNKRILGTEPRSSEEQPVPLAGGPSLQPRHTTGFLKFTW